MPSRNGSGAVYLGLDPGASGGLAVVWEGRDGPPKAFPMPATDRDIWDLIIKVQAIAGSGVFALLEKVGGYVAGNASPGSAMFRFGQSYGALRMALTAAEAIWEEVTPQQWQRELSLPPRKKTEGKGAWKNRLKAKAQQLFPTVRVTLATADALLIAEVCRRRHERSKL
jgi:hypothetical protein